MDNKEVADRLTKLYLLGQSERPIQCYTRKDLEALEIAQMHFKHLSVEDKLYEMDT